MQIKHIIPQKIVGNWEKELGENWQEIHGKHLHTLHIFYPSPSISP